MLDRVLLCLAGALCVAGCTPRSTATEQAAHPDDDWPVVGHDQQGSYYSPLKQIDAGNVQRLGFAWDYQLDTNRGLEATPIVIGGVMYAVGNWGIVYALDAATGALKWSYNPQVDGRYWGRYACCDVVNRGIVVANDTVYVGAIDGYLHALDAATGVRRWRVDTLTERGPQAFHYFISGAPVLAGNLIAIGNGGSDFTGARGFVSAFDAKSGALKWRFFSVPRDPALGEQDQPHLKDAIKSWPAAYDWRSGGGGSAWDALNYDPDLQLVYFGTAHASPYRISGEQPGGSDQLYTASIIAVHANDGTRAWSYQTTPGDGWDYDATAKLILADLTIAGKQRRAVMQANKNGFFYVLDRASGEFISAQPYAFQNWSTGFDPVTHRPQLNPRANWQSSPKLVYPAATGAHNWQPMSFSAQTRLAYIPTIDAAMVYIDTSKRRAGLIEGNFELAFFFPEDYDPQALSGMFGTLPPMSELTQGKAPPKSRGSVRAFDPVTGKLVWEQTGDGVWDGGILSTAGNLVVRGTTPGMLKAYAADSGKLLKTLDVGTSIMAAPMSYRVNGTQYVAVMAGYGGGVLFAPFPATSAAAQYGNQGRIVVFKLDGGEVPKPAPYVEAPFVQPPSREGTPETIARGEVLYTRYCSRCHAFGHGLLPDLRRLSPATHQLFYEIVLNGAYEPKGMSRWSDVLSQADAQAVHAFILDQAWQAFDAQKLKTH